MWEEDVLRGGESVARVSSVARLFVRFVLDEPEPARARLTELVLVVTAGAPADTTGVAVVGCRRSLGVGRFISSAYDDFKCGGAR